MEIFRHMRERWALARQGKAKEERKQKLEKYYSLRLNKELVRKALTNYGITTHHNERVRNIGQAGDIFFVVGTYEEEFLQAVSKLKPKEIVYQLVNMRDDYSAGDFYVKIDDEVAIEVTGLIDDVSGTETLFSRLYNLNYRTTQHHTYEQRWGILSLQEVDQTNP